MTETPVKINKKPYLYNRPPKETNIPKIGLTKILEHTEKKEKIIFLKNSLEKLKQTKHINEDEMTELKNFFYKNFKNIFMHDFAGKMTNIYIDIFLIESGKKTEIDAKKLKILNYFLEYCLIYLGEKSLTEINIEGLENFLKIDILDFYNKQEDFITVSFKEESKNFTTEKDVNVNITNNTNKNLDNLYLNIIKGDLYFLLINIIKNSVKHGNADKIDIILEEKNGDLILKIIDNGDGIKGFENINDIFKPGVTSGDGTGTGIQIADERMLLIDGKINAENSENGAIITITIPLKIS